ncbi:MAG: AAA family ATPase [Sulfitobacter sp.]
MRFGSYTLLEKLKQRGPVITRRAQETSTKRPVIIKTLQKDAVSPEQVAALRREYAMIREISSSRVVTAIELVWEDDCPGLVLDDLGGQVLANRLTGQPMALNDALNMALGTARALEAVHDAGIMHGDINPYNLLLGDNPSDIALIDFGFSERGGLPPREGAGLRGSPNYIAPELTGRLSQGADSRADLYSLGVLMYQMLTGQLPFQAGDLLQMVYAHMALQPRPLLDLAPNVPVVVVDLVARLISKRPEQRYQTAAGLCADLEYCLAVGDGGAAAADFVLGAQDIPRKLSLSKSLQGRESESQRLREAFDQVQSGAPAGLSIEIVGAAGVGKTTLVNAALTYADRNGGMFVTGRLDAGAWDDTLGGLVQAAQRIAELVLTERFGSLEFWQKRLTEGQGDLLSVLVPWVPELVAIVGDVALPSTLDPRESAERLTQAFRWFFRLCATPEHPLVLVLEDVHAADFATMGLLDGLARSEGPEHMLLILTRRADPALSEQTTSNVDELIRLEDLKAGDVAEMLCETFRRSHDDCMPLAETMVNKVGGGPLAVGQFLGALVDDGDVRFDKDAGGWVWDLPAILARDSSDDVVGILVSRSARMTSEERATIGAIACIGRSFTLDEAEAAAGTEAEDVALHLERAVSMGWIAPEVHIGEQAQPAGLRFLHDRVWEAALDLLDPKAQRAAHGRLCALYLEAAGGQPPEGELLFTLARHLGAALGPDAAAQDKAQARGLNAMAGGSAIAVGDLQRSHFHFGTAADLLAPEDIGANPEEALGIIAGAAGAALLVGNFDAMKSRLESFFTYCPDPTACARIQTLNIFANLAQNRATDAIEFGRDAMAALGDPLPDVPGPAEIEAEVDAVFMALAGRSIETILELPDVSDPVHGAGHEVLSATQFAAYSANPLMFAVVAARLTARALREGISAGALEGINGFGIMACGPMNQVDLGYGISQIARQVVENKGLNGARARVETIHNAFIRHRKEPIRDTLGALLDARDTGIACGDIHSAALASFDHGFQVFWIGERLESAHSVLRDAAHFCDDVKAGIFPDLIKIYRQTTTRLLKDPTPEDTTVRDRTALAAIYHQRRDVNGLAQLHILQMLEAHIFGKPEIALEEGRLAATFLDGIVSTPAVPAFHAMFAIIATPSDGSAPTAQDQTVLDAGRAVTDLWAEHAPDNYAHHALITRAEEALAKGDEATWLEDMEAAADHATQHVFKRDAAIILERIAKVCQVQGKHRRFNHYLRDAWRAWVHYGADAKVAAMSDEYGDVVESSVSSEQDNNHSLSLSVQDEQLDFGALLKATRSISQEVQLADLLSALLAGIVETAGATRAMVLAPELNQFRIIAELSAGSDGPIYASAPDIASGHLCEADAAPLSALRLVSRLRGPLSSSDMTGDTRLSGDPYLRDTPPKALAIVPMLNGGRLLGLVYLENHEISDAFSPMRLNLLSALCAQAAVSWDNATLYDHQSRLLAAADRFVPAELSRLFNRDSIADVQLTDARAGRMTLMVSDLRGSTSQAEQLGPQQTFSQINAFLSGFSRNVRDHGGFVLKYIGDGVLAVFPDGPAQAMDAAVAYQEELKRRTWDPAAGVTLQVGIAIHAGDVMFGVVGDETRMQIDALSDAVNVVFRLESMTKKLGAKVLVSNAALEDVAEADAGRHRCRFLGEVETQGRLGLEPIHELLDAEPQELREVKLRTQEMFEQGVRCFEKNDFVNACVHLGSVLRDSPGDVAASHLFQEAARRMSQSPG